MTITGFRNEQNYVQPRDIDSLRRKLEMAKINVIKVKQELKIALKESLINSIKNNKEL